MSFILPISLQYTDKTRSHVNVFYSDGSQTGPHSVQEEKIQNLIQGLSNQKENSNSLMVHDQNSSGEKLDPSKQFFSNSFLTSLGSSSLSKESEVAILPPPPLPIDNHLSYFNAAKEELIKIGYLERENRSTAENILNGLLQVENLERVMNYTNLVENHRLKSKAIILKFIIVMRPNSFKEKFIDEPYFSSVATVSGFNRMSEFAKGQFLDALEHISENSATNHTTIVERANSYLQDLENLSGKKRKRGNINSLNGYDYQDEKIVRGENVEKKQKL